MYINVVAVYKRYYPQMVEVHGAELCCLKSSRHCQAQLRQLSPTTNQSQSHNPILCNSAA
jgi:hypothetical protein